MFRSRSNFNRARQALVRAFILAMIVAGAVGIPRVYAARSTANAAEIVSPANINICAAGLQSSDYYLRQEEAILNKVIQSNWNASEMASLNSSTTCVAGMQSSDYYLRQEEAILSKVTQSNWNADGIASLGGSISIAQASH